MSLDIHSLVLSGVYSKAHIHSWCLPEQAGEKAADSTTQHLPEERAHSNPKLSHSHRLQK
jgi:hypothetical protein